MNFNSELSIIRYDHTCTSILEQSLESNCINGQQDI